MEYPMNTADVQGWSDEDRLILSDFLTLNPPLSCFPHLIFKAARESLEQALSVVGAKGGLWGELLPFDSSGNEYVVEEWPVIGDFRLWGEPPNQGYLLDSGWGVSPLLDFTMVIDAYSNPGLLAELASASTFFGKQPLCDWRADFEQLSRWVDALGWAYVPLKQGELDHAFFLVSKANERWIEALQARLAAANFRTARLRHGTQRVHWEGPLVL
jgi:hypothetical protein